MKNILLALCCVVSLAACVTSSAPSPYDTRNPWDRTDTQAPAQTGPDTLAQTQTQQWINAGNTTSPLERPLGESAVGSNPYPGVERTPLPPADQMENQIQNQTTPPPSGYAAVFGQAGVVPRAMPQVKVALLVPLSGRNADVGEALMNAAQLALFDVGADGFQLMPQDTKGTAAGAAAATQAALHDGAQMILGPLFAEEVRAAAPLAAAANINMVAFTTDWKQAGGTTFVMGFMPFGQVQRVIEFAAQNGLKRLGVIAPQSEYGDAVMSAYMAAAQRSGVITVDSLRFHPGDTTLSLPIQKFSRIDSRKRPDGTFVPPPFDAVFLPTGGNDAKTIANLLSYYELDSAQIRRLGTGLWDGSGLLRETNLNGGWFAAPDPAARRNFEAKYQNAYGATPPRLASLGYDATALAAVLAKTGQKNTGLPAFSRAALANPNGFAGVDGIFRFRSDGLAERGLAILEMKNGQHSVIDPAPASFQNAPR